MTTLRAYLCNFDIDFEQFEICTCSDGVFAPNEALNRYICTACGGVMPDNFLEDDDDRLDPFSICEACGGTGNAGGIEDLPCPECNGEGRLW